MIDQLIPYLPGFVAAYAILVVAVASPGPGVALILGHAVSEGRRAALLCSLGIAVGSASLALATTQGLGLLMERVAWLSTIVRIAGVCYLLWLAFKAWRKALTPPQVSIAKVRAMSPSRVFLSGYLLQITNPKAIVFWLAIATVGATKAAPLPVVALFILGAFLLSLAGHAAYAVLLSSQPFRLAYDRARRWIEGVIGAFLTYVAFRLATDRS
ncbi:LysE family translocator [Paracoccus aurantiacus]|uniref:LysE family translocator n=1 Tax=Paracoccus aurantiacus TaxID=2599412 RepID=A0A5C6S5I0_9RHOB|nr:LysE family translocator [Paracoccus aurantiacus]TXB69860.1 LysE family translocator [Paracoccus aurantiacus]